MDLLEGVDWMRLANTTNVVLNDTIDRIANLTCVTRFRADRELWRTIQTLEAKYGVEVHLTGHVFIRPWADTKPLNSQEFWEDFIQDAVRLTIERLNQ